MFSQTNTVMPICTYLRTDGWYTTQINERIILNMNYSDPHEQIICGLFFLFLR